MELRDPVCSISHFAAALWSLGATLLLLRASNADLTRKIAFGIFGASMVMLYTASAVFHGLPYTQTENPWEFRLFQRIDQSAIFVLIAGTNTPIIVSLLRGIWKHRYLWGMWSLAAAGIASIWLLPKPPHEVIVSISLLMGWLGMIPVVEYYRAIGWRAMNRMWVGTFLYTIAAICELVQWPVIGEYPVRIGYHEVFHLLIAAAGMAFFAFVARYVLPHDHSRAHSRETITNEATSKQSEAPKEFAGARLDG